MFLDSLFHVLSCMLCDLTAFLCHMQNRPFKSMLVSHAMEIFDFIMQILKAVMQNKSVTNILLCSFK